MDEVDRVEARYFLSTPDQQAEQRRRGYITGMEIPAPSVVSVNGTIAAIALNELAIYLSGSRPISPLTMIDLLGRGQALLAQWSTPVRVESRRGCFTCTLAGRGDDASVERYALLG